MTTHKKNIILKNNHKIKIRSEKTAGEKYPSVAFLTAQWTAQAGEAFPMGASFLQTVISVLNYVQDSFVRDMLTHISLHVRFVITENNAVQTVQYDAEKQEVLLQKSYVSRLATSGWENTEIYVFLGQLIMALNKASLDTRGLLVRHVSCINLIDAVLFDLLADVDSELVKARFLREMLLSFEDGLQAFHDSFLMHYLACKGALLTHPDSVDMVDGETAVNAVFALNLLDFSADNPHFREWRQMHLEATINRLLFRPLGSLTFRAGNRHIKGKFERYYGARFPVLRAIRHTLHDFGIDVLKEYVKASEQMKHGSFPKENLSYKDATVFIKKN